MTTVEHLTVCDWPVPVLSILDRRSRRSRRARFLFVRSVEAVVWNAKDKSTGVLFQALQRASLESSILRVDKQTVEDGLVMPEEFDTMMACFLDSCVPDVEARRRCRQFSLVPLAAVVSVCTAHGRTAATVELLKALRSLPRVWKMQEEQEENSRKGEVDFVLDERLEEELEETLEDWDLATELVMEYVQWEPDPDADAHVGQLQTIGRTLQKQLHDLEAFRTSKLNRHRIGSACQPITFAGEKAALLRFLNWVLQSHDVAEPTLDILARPELGRWVEEYAQWLESRELKCNSISNYLSALIQSVVYCIATSDEIVTSSYDQICNLRRQCDKLAGQDQLYRRRADNWIEFDDVQRTRVAAIEAYNAADGEEKRCLLKTVLIIALHSYQPPDRV